LKTQLLNYNEQITRVEKNDKTIAVLVGN